MAHLSFLADDWPLISRRLDEVLALAPAQREAWLDALDEAAPIKHKLRQLLCEPVGIETDDLLATLPRLALAAAETMPPDSTEGIAAAARIGPYRLIRELGAGGMGVVWLAERADGGLKRQVALKLPRLNWSQGLAERMIRERDILASLDHPNIARIHDAGLDDHGRPYLALEYVEGEAIDVYCRALALTIHDRLMLVLQVARGVAHAHARLVVHRDLKPANILVTAAGQARLLDFGIAKLMEGELTQETLLTRQGGRALTLDYASPEQIRGEPIGTASDVYSLGVVAYELLAEAKPYQLKRQSAAALEEAIASVDVRLASTAAASPSARRGLQGDLDAILNKALKKSVAERYPSVEAFTQDIERHLARLPVLARPDALAYRARKFVARYRFETAGVLLAVLGLATAAAVALVQARSATLEARKSEAVKAFLLQMLTSADPGMPVGRPPGEVSVQQLLDRTSEEVASSLDEQPDVKIDMLYTLASAYSTIDRGATSIALLKQGLALSERHDGVPHANQARFLAYLANVEVFAGHFDAADAWLGRAEPVFAALGDNSSLSYAQALKLRGLLLRRGGTAAFPAARRVLQQAAAVFRQRYPADEGRVGTLMQLAQVERGLDDLTAALAMADEAVAVASLNGGRRIEAANAQSLRAAVRDAAGDAQGALADYTAAAQGYTRLAGPEHFLTLQNDSLRGLALLHLGRQAEGLAAMATVADRLGHTRAGSNTHAAAVTRLGVALVQLGLIERAEPVLRQTMAIWQQRGDALQLSGAVVALANVLQQRGDEAAAKALLDEALAVRQRQEHHTLLPLAEVQYRLGLLALDAARHDEAQRQLQASLASAGGPGPGDQAQRSRSQAALARLALARGDAGAALATSQAALTAAEASLLAGDALARAAALEARGAIACALGQPAEGKARLAQALALRDPLIDAMSLEGAATRLSLAVCLQQLGHDAQAREALATARTAIATHPQVATLLAEQLRHAGELLGPR
ncbi:serine/threonine-protein kinase [Aquabacterium sp.]|uniref:serine/threonine-protein kinase n=1 Tax=Aquabacterium sp. TaxID=1872578 RepID=UPI002C9CC925|nr:serine/threonine-protein kinase [Aquabacterium sp.]HSW04213.1 serine/threonine-protein kinase [Aquabacterium sp.]